MGLLVGLVGWGRNNTFKLPFTITTSTIINNNKNKGGASGRYCFFLGPVSYATACPVSPGGAAAAEVDCTDAAGATSCSAHVDSGVGRGGPPGAAPVHH